MKNTTTRSAALSSLEHEAHRRFLCYELTSAQAAAEHLVAIAPTRDYAHYLLGEVARRRRRWDEAYRCFSRAHALGRNDVWTLYRCTEAAFRAGDRDAAKRWLQLAEGCSENDQTVARALASFRRFMGSR